MSDIAKRQVLLELEDRLTQLEMDVGALRVKQEKLMFDKSVVLQGWAFNFVETMSEDKKKYLYDVLKSDFDSDTEEPSDTEDYAESVEEDDGLVWCKSPGVKLNLKNNCLVI